MENQGIRVQKFLSDNGILSRRKAEDAIREGRILVNGVPALIGQKINPKRDVVTADNVAVKPSKKKQNIYILLNKPRGYVTTTEDEMGRNCVVDLVADLSQKVYPVGRLDKLSEGLLLLTNDGDFANTVMHPRNHVPKTYRVTVRGSVTEEHLIALATGIDVDGKPTLPAAVHVITDQPGRTVIQLTIYEGRNRQIRKMCEALKLDVVRLKRIAIGPLKLGMLQPGKWREITPAELLSMRAAIKKKRIGSRRRKEDFYYFAK